MAHPRRFRFGIQLANAASADDWATQARRAEDLGYDCLLMPDHFGDQFAPLPALVAAAEATTDLRVGILVLDNDYRHPLVAAKELATVDVLTRGRLEIGLGAGWMLSDYEQSGIAYDPPKTRVDRFEEGLEIILGLLGPDPVNFSGEHYTITDATGLPRPVQTPHPPLIVGGGRERVLRIAARHADIVGINPSIPSGAIDAAAAQTGTAAETDQKIGWIRDEAGDRYADLEINLLNFACIVTDDRDTMIDNMAPLFGLSPDELRDFPHALIGTVDQLCDAIETRRERWDASYVVVQGDAMETFAPVVARLAGS